MSQNITPSEAVGGTQRFNLVGGPNSMEPKRKPRKGEPGSLGDQAFTDAVTVVAVSWVLLLLLAFSLRRHLI